VSTEIPLGRRRLDVAKIGGFLAGAVLTIVLGLVAGVVYSGQGLGDPPREMEPVYTAF
jgi:hypothetical protein